MRSSGLPHVGEIAKHDKNGSEDPPLQRSGAGKERLQRSGAGKERMDGKDMGAPSRTSGTGLSGVQSGIIEPVMVRVPEGWFGMGCESGRDDEKPVHRVWVDAFELAAYQVTNAEYGRFLAATNCVPPPCWSDANFHHPKMPVVAVSWHEAASYCEWLSGATGKRYHLPSEAEWERAARGGAEGLLYPWGDAPPEMVSRLRQAVEAGTGTRGVVCGE